MNVISFFLSIEEWLCQGDGCGVSVLAVLAQVCAAGSAGLSPCSSAGEGREVLGWTEAGLLYCPESQDYFLLFFFFLNYGWNWGLKNIHSQRAKSHSEVVSGQLLVFPGEKWVSLLSSHLVSFALPLLLSLLLSLGNLSNQSSIETACSHGVLVQIKIILLINSLKLQKCDFTWRIIYYRYVAH